MMTKAAFKLFVLVVMVWLVLAIASISLGMLAVLAVLFLFPGKWAEKMEESSYRFLFQRRPG